MLAQVQAIDIPSPYFSFALYGEHNDVFELEGRETSYGPSNCCDLKDCDVGPFRDADRPRGVDLRDTFRSD